jgi:Cap4 SAVED domain
MTTDDDKLLPTGRPRMYLDSLLVSRQYSENGLNPCFCISLADPQNEYRDSLITGLRKILPFMYRTKEQAFQILLRYGVDFVNKLPLPPSEAFQWAHAGEFLMCAYFEECEKKVVLTYKWRLNTTRNQHQFGMDLIAFDLQSLPPKIYLIAVKTTAQGKKGAPPSVISEAVTELETYLKGEKINDDLEIISAHLHTDDPHRVLFEGWYDPYTQNNPASRPHLVPVPAFVVEAAHWQDKFARRAISKDFGTPGIVTVLCIDDLEEVVRRTYSQET